METSRMALYTSIALISVVIAYYFLVQEPHPDWPINLVHLLARH